MIFNIVDSAPSDSTKLYRYEVVTSSGTGTGEYMYLKYAPGTLLKTPTAINRATLMAMQGFTSCTTTFNPDGSITEVGTTGTKVTTFNTDGSITEVFTDTNNLSITKTTTFNVDGSISEVIS